MDGLIIMEYQLFVRTVTSLCDNSHAEFATGFTCHGGIEMVLCIGILTFSILAYYNVKYSPKYAPVRTAGAHFGVNFSI